MTRSRHWFALILVTLPAVLALPPASGQAPSPASKASDEWNLDRKLTVTPMLAPVPALKYSLLPLTSDLKEGNAAPMYLRLNHEQTDEARRYWSETPKPWNKQPVDQIPLTDAREFMSRMKHFYRQIELAARRRTAEWNYPLDYGSLIEIPLPDVQVLRQLVPMMILPARVALADGDFAAAARSLETGFAFCRHIAEQPFLIHSLIAIACATQFADTVLDYVERPGAPNLYWALAALPRPFIDLRRALDFEQRVVELQFPDLADLDRPRSAAQWDALLKHIRSEVKRFSEHDKEYKGPPPGAGPDDPAARSVELPAAKEYVAERRRLSAAAVNAMPPAQVLVLYIVGVSRDFRDEGFKAAYLPYPEARPLLTAARARLDANADTEPARFAKLLVPSVDTLLRAQNRIDRRIAALRVIEALRMHAAGNGGQLPDRLDQVTVVPVPDDPGTGKPFEYRKEGATATLIGRIPGESLSTTGVRYTIAMRGK